MGIQLSEVMGQHRFRYHGRQGVLLARKRIALAQETCVPAHCMNQP